MLKLINVSKQFSIKDNCVHALSNINLSIHSGEIFGVIGQSGAGKSTLVRCINLLERPSEGQVIFDEIDLTKLSPKELQTQRSKIGMIFQQFNLLEQKTVLANVCFALEIHGIDKETAKQKACKMLEVVGLSDKLNAYPSQLSGGQKQRVAIARALVNRPQILLCDEATSALDPATRNTILDLLSEINQKFHVTIVMITHEMSIIEAICDRVAVLNQGELVEIGKTTDVLSNPKSSATLDLLGQKKPMLTYHVNKKGA